MSETKKGAPSILDRLAQGDLLITDGGTGTYLQAHGLEPGACSEELNISLPEVVKGMARDYFDAGALLYQHVPLLGAAIRWLQRRLA